MLVRDLLANLLRDSKISKETLCIASGLTQAQVEEYLTGDSASLKKEDVYYLDELGMLLGSGLHAASEDERIRAILECLLDVYKFNIEQLSKLLNVDSLTIEKILSGAAMDAQSKYEFAVREAYLFYALKKACPK